MQIFHKKACFTLMFISHLFLLSYQSRMGRWRQLNHWKYPNELISNLDKDNEECAINDNKCLKGRTNFDKILFNELIQNNLIDDTELKEEQSKRYAVGNPAIMSPLLNAVDESRNLRNYKSGLSPTCSCDIQYKLSDLGHDYYPRYVSSAICPSKTCRGSLYTCQPKYYVIYFLKRKTDSSKIGNNSDAKPLVPEALRNEWEFEPVSVAVSCECLL